MPGFLLLLLSGKSTCMYVCPPLMLLKTSGIIYRPHMYGWLNKFHSLYMVAVLVSLVGVALELKCVIEIRIQPV